MRILCRRGRRNGRNGEKHYRVDAQSAPEGITTVDAAVTPLEGWLFLLRNLHNFADAPEGMDKRFEPIVRAARMKDLPGKEQLQYFRAMISEDTKQDYYLGGYDAGMEAGYAEGMEKGVEKGMEKGTIEGIMLSARKLIASGMTRETVSRILELNEEQLKEL